jgi:hypothetical protein
VIVNAISPKVHGFIDYAMAGQLISAPYLFGFKKDKLATTIALTAGFSVLGVSLLTRYPLGAVKVIPFKTHGIIETGAASFLAISPLLFNFRKGNAAKFLSIAGIAYLGVIAMTNYRGVPKVVRQANTDQTQVAA